MVDPMICVVTCLFIVFDIISGVAQAVANKDLKSEKLRVGLFHKMAFVFAIALAFLIEYSISYIDLGFTVPLVVPVCAYVCLTEIISITENIAKLNPELKNSKFLQLFHVEDEQEE